MFFADNTLDLPHNFINRIFIHNGLEGIPRQLQVRHELGQAMLQRLNLAQLTQRNLGTILQGMANVSRWNRAMPTWMQPCCTRKS